MAEQKMLKITLVKSPIGAVPKHRATVESMGLRKSIRQWNYLTMHAQEVWFSR